MRTLMLTSSLVLSFIVWTELINAEGYQYDKPSREFPMPTAANLVHNFLTAQSANIQNFGQHAVSGSNVPMNLQQDHFNQAPSLDFGLQRATTFPAASHNLQNYQQNNALPVQSSLFAPTPQTQNLGQNSINQVTSKRGDYISQSEASQLDQYPYKQRQAGDSRPYRRFVTTCYQNGHCENQELALDGLDQQHQSIINALRAHIQYSPTNCPIGLQTAGSNNVASGQQSREQRQYIPPVQPQFLGAHNGNFAQATHGLGAQVPAQTAPVVRPPERRLYPYNEIVGPGIFN